MTTQQSLFQPMSAGPLSLGNRIAMAPMTRSRAPGNVPDSTVQGVREAFPGVLMLAGNFDRDRAETVLADGSADVVAFARGFIANPDLPERMRLDLPLASFDAATLYTPGSDGYSDCPGYDVEPTLAA